MQVDDKERHFLIKEAAYFLAEQRNFAPGHEQEDWLAAERQVDDMLRSLHQADTQLQQDGAAGQAGQRRPVAATGRSSRPRRRETGVQLEQEKAAEGVTGIGLPESEIVSDYHPGGPLKKPSATPNPAVAAAAILKRGKKQ